jgi:maltooligosyltrehalose trehalohydrolase
VTRAGRKREFEGFTAFGGELPDPQDLATFRRSKLEPRTPDPLVAELLRLRKELPRELDVSFDEAERTLELRRGGATLHVDFRRLEVGLDR